MYGRNTDFGVENVLRSFATWNGSSGWDSDPDLVKANLIITPVGPRSHNCFVFSPASGSHTTINSRPSSSRTRARMPKLLQSRPASAQPEKSSQTKPQSTNRNSRFLSMFRRCTLKFVHARTFCTDPTRACWCPSLAKICEADRTACYTSVGPSRWWGFSKI